MPTIDQKVVEMRFDNRQFESGVSQSLSTLDRLKSALQFNSLGADLSRVSAGVNTIGKSFTSMGVIARRVLENIGDLAYNTGAKLVNSLAINNIVTGWQKYADITSATQTIMAATRHEWKDQAAQMDYVTEHLKKLNWFTDETSYNLIDMVSNIGKFTSAGIGLEDATKAMMGIATWAGISGANTQQASNAMYNLAQAMGTGAVKIQDWMSIENANMATKEFKDTAIKLGYQLGTLKKDAKGAFYTFDKDGHKVVVTSENIRQTLSTGWLDKKVLTKTLDTYGNFANELHKYTESTGLSATEMLEYVQKIKDGELKISETVKKIPEKYLKNGVFTGDPKVLKNLKETTVATKEFEELAKDLGVDVKELAKGLTVLSADYNDLGFNAFRAAQEAKTFTEAVNYTSDAISTKWMTTFQTIFGNYQQSKELWTGLTEEIYDLLIEDLDNQNEVLDKWAELGGREETLNGIIKIWESIKDALMTVKSAVREIFPPPTAEALYSMAVRFNIATSVFQVRMESLVDTLKKFLIPTLSGLKLILDGLKSVFGSIKDAFNEAFPKPSMDAILSFANQFRIFASGLQLRLEDLGKVLKNVIVPVFNTLRIAASSIAKVFNALRRAFEAVFPPGRKTIIEGIAAAIEKIAKVFEITEERSKKLERIFKGLFSIIDILRMAIIAILEPILGVKKGADGLVDGVLDLTAGFADWITSIANLIREHNTFGKIVGWVTGIVNGLIEGANKLSIAFTGMNLSELWESIKESAGKAYNSISKFFGMSSSDDAENTEKSAITLSGLFDRIANAVEGLKKKWQEVKPHIDNLLDRMGKVFNIKLNGWDDLEKTLKQGGILAILGGIVYTIYKIYDNIWNILWLIPKEIGANIAYILGSVADTLDAFQKRIKAEIITSVTKSIMRLAIALVLLSIIDTDALAKACLVMAELFLTLELFITNLAKKMSDFDGPKLLALGLVMKKFAMAMIEIALAIAIVANTKGDTVGAAIALGILTACMAEIIKLVSNSGIDPVRVQAFGKSMQAIAFAMLQMAAAIAVVTIVAKNPTQLLAAVAALGVMMAAMIAILVKVGESNFDQTKIAGLGAAMIALGFALLEVSVALAIIAKVAKNPVQLTAAVLALSVMLAALAVAVNNMPKDLPAIAAGLLIASAAIVVLAAAIAIVANLNPDNLVPGMEALIVLLVAVVGAIALLGFAKENALMAGAALTVAAIGIVILASALKTLSEINDFNGVLMMAAALGVLVVAAFLAQKVAPGLLILASSILLIGAGAALFGAAVSLAANALIKLLSAGEEGADVFVYAMGKIINILPELIGKIAEGIVNFIKVIADNAGTLIDGIATFLSTIIKAITKVLPDLFELIKTFIIGILDVLIGIMPKILEFLGTLIIGICKLIIDSAPYIVESIIVVTKEFLRSLREIIPDLTYTFFYILKDTLRQIRDNIEEIVKLSVEIGILTITGFIKGIKEQIPNIVETGWEFVIALINGVADGVEKHAKELREAIEKLANALINGFCTILGIHSPSTVFENFGGNIIAGLVEGIKENAKKAWEAAKKLASDIAEKIKEKFGQFKDLASTAINNMRDGFTFAATAVIEKAKEIGGKIKAKFEELKDKFKEIGSNLINALKKGLTDAKDKLVKGASDVGETVIGAIKKVFKIKSPSRVFMEIGEFLDEGLAIGLTNYSSTVVDATEDVGDAAIRSMSNTISNIADMVEDEMDTEPTIRPVLDLSDVTDGVGTINDMLAADRSISLATSSGTGINNSMSQQLTMQAMFDSLKNTLSKLGSDGGTVNNNTFNITGDDPKAIADEVSRILQNKVERRDAAWA